MLNIRNELILIQLLLHSSCKCCWAKKEEEEKKNFPLLLKDKRNNNFVCCRKLSFFIVLVCNIIVHEKKHHVLQCLEILRRICYIADHRSIFFWFVHFWYQLLHYVVLWLLKNCLSIVHSRVSSSQSWWWSLTGCWSWICPEYGWGARQSLDGDQLQHSLYLIQTCEGRNRRGFHNREL